MTKGYSLIELIIVVGLTGILTIAITAISMTTLLSSTRVRNLVKTRQAGDSALNQLQTSIRNAREITACSSASDTVTITNPDGNTTLYRAISDGTSVRIASGSGYITPQDIVVSSFDLSCTPSDATPNVVHFKYSLTNRVTGLRSTETPVIPYDFSVQIRN